MVKLGVRAVAVVVIVGAIGFLGWRTRSLQEEIDRARADAAVRRAAETRLADALERAREDLASTARALGDARRDGRRLEQRLDSSQSCDRRPAGHLWLSPPSGPVGTRVAFTGDCFVFSAGDSRRDLLAGYGIFLMRQLGDLHPTGECEQIVGASPSDIEFEEGRVQGFFTVGREGGCFQHNEGPYPVVPGDYAVGIGCHSCTTNASFRVTP